MYYIVNQDKQIIAADADFLSLLEIESLQELFVQVASGKISFEEMGNHTLEITVAGSNTLTLDKKSYPLTTLVGDLLLNEVSEPEEAEETVEEEKDNTISGFDTLPDEEMIDFIKPEEEPAEEEAEEEEEEEAI
jgi:outer membrane biosynthesis protein TonB